MSAFRCAAALFLLTTASGAIAQVPLPAPAAPPQSTLDVALLFDQGKRLFDAFQYDQSIPLFDRVVSALATSSAVPKPDLLLQAYDFRARARFAVGDSTGAEQDFSALLSASPGYKLASGVSARVAAVFDSVRKLVVGQVELSMTVPGDVDIDGRPYPAKAEPQTVDILAGDHQVSVKRQGYREIAQRVSVPAGGSVALAITLERISATLAVLSVPSGVDVTMDGQSRGQTVAGDPSSDASAPLLVTDLPLGAHRLQLSRACFTPLERTITIDQFDDLRTEPLRLTPSVASVKIQTTEPGAVLYVDGARRGAAPADIPSLCAGPHVIEVRSPKGRFIDRRDWRTGDAVTLTATVRSAFPIVATSGGAAAAMERLRGDVERALASSRGLFVYAPAPAELDAALRGEDVPADWLTADPSNGGQVSARITRLVRRDLATKIAGKLESQGLAALSVGPDPNVVWLSLVAAGSGEPEVLRIDLNDAASRTGALDMLGAAIPPLTRASLETSVVDVAGVPGAVVVRAVGAGAAAGLAMGDVIVRAGTTTVASVADLQAAVAAVRAPATELALEVKNVAGASRQVSGRVAMVPEAMALRDSSISYNRALIELQSAVKSASAPAERSAAHVNLAIVHMRLGNWDDAQTELAAAQLADGPGVSAGTVAYLLGVCLENVGHTAEAQAAFTKAAAAAEARLSSDGPLIAPLAQQKLGRR